MLYARGKQSFEDHRRLHVHSKKVPLLLEAGLSKPATTPLVDQEACRMM